ncbi:hypothetical protein PLANPX_5187 [Lacipirellula parvula]|uniref:Uncharacterized protein n=1 Tax=Lacipirellula parvula TaxID=2650471 RepID=A0A5K7XGQ3_9BACT|nr:hypothetical protein PLANPX_5187 [Lacipirellula parvula]
MQSAANNLRVTRRLLDRSNQCHCLLTSAVIKVLLYALNSGAIDYFKRTLPSRFR